MAPLQSILHAPSTGTILGKTMVAALLSAPGQVDYRDCPMPAPSPTQLLVKIEGCGVCSTHTPFWQGRVQCALEPGAPGRDAWGRVVSTGREVYEFSPGDRVAFLSSHSYAQYDVVEAAHAVSLPEKLADIPFPGRSLSTAVNIFRRACINPGDRVAILGIGFTGAILTQLAALAQAEVLVVSERRCPLRLAQQLGATQAFAVDKWLDKEALLLSIREAQKSKGGEALYDVVVETSGTQEALDLAAELTRERGRLVVAGRRHDGNRTVDMRLWNWRGLDIINAHERSPALYVEGLREAVAAVSAELITPEPLYTHRFSFDRLGEALTLATERPEGFIKAIVDM